MKKIYNLAAALLVTTSLLAQQAYQPTARTLGLDDSQERFEEMKKRAFARRAANLNRANSKMDTVIARLGHTNERGIAISFVGLNRYVAPILPDSLASEIIQGDPSPVNIHGFGGILDPTSNDFTSQDLGIQPQDDYTVDTIWISGLYTTVNPAVRDTLVIQMFVSDTGGGSDAFIPLSLVDPGGAFDGAPARGLRYSSSPAHGVQTTSTASGIIEEKYVLQLGDTNQFLAIETGGIDVPAGNLFGFFAYFSPGATWGPADIYFDQQGTTATMNSWVIFGLQDDNSGVAGDFWAYDPTSYGGTHTLFSASRYQTFTAANQTFLNTTVTPTFGGGNEIEYSFHAYDVSQPPDPPIGIAAIDTKSVLLGDNYPNPFNQNTFINYTVQETGNVQFEITDITGKTVASVNEGTRTPGLYRIELSAENFKSGVYYYTAISNGSRVTKKMIVTK